MGKYLDCLKLNPGEALAKVLWYYGLIPSLNTAEQKIVCPFHRDVNPSMIINLESGSWFCFGCNLSGDSIRFVILMEHKLSGLSELQALKKYFRILCSNKVQAVNIQRFSKASKKPSRQAYIESYDYYHCLSKIDWKACEDPDIKECKRYMIKRGFTPDVLTKVKAKYTYNNQYPLIFPMLDNGKFKGWVCRTTTKAIEEKRKYLYNEGFSRANTLVGNYGSKDYVIVVEGYMDRLKFLQFGEDNVVAILGWKMSDNQIAKLKSKGIQKVISALDNDKCGIKGTNYLKQHFDVLRFSYLKNIKDPGEMNLDTFKKMINKTNFRRKKRWG